MPDAGCRMPDSRLLAKKVPYQAPCVRQVSAATTHHLHANAKPAPACQKRRPFCSGRAAAAEGKTLNLPTIAARRLVCL